MTLSLSHLGAQYVLKVCFVIDCYSYSTITKDIFGEKKGAAFDEKNTSVTSLASTAGERFKTYFKIHHKLLR